MVVGFLALESKHKQKHKHAPAVGPDPLRVSLSLHTAQSDILRRLFGVALAGSDDLFCGWISVHPDALPLFSVGRAVTQ